MLRILVGVIDLLDVLFYEATQQHPAINKTLDRFLYEVNRDSLGDSCSRYVMQQAYMYTRMRLTFRLS